MRVLLFQRRAAATAIALAVSLPSHAVRLFQQDFQTATDPITGLPGRRCLGPGGPGTYPFPPGWVLRNVDNRTPDGSVSYVNEAWEVRDEFPGDGSSCTAYSNSYHAPAGGSADDWMWTPLIGPIPAGATTLSWRARSYDAAFRDAYEVRVMVLPAMPGGGTGVLGNQVSASTLLLSVAAEETTWTTRSVSLSPFAGERVYIGFRNHSNDKFLLTVDDIAVDNERYDLVALAAGARLPYARVPSGFAATVDLQVRAANFGTFALGNVQASAQLRRDGESVGAVIPAPAPVTSLAPSQTATLGWNSPLAIGDAGRWTLDYTVSADESPMDAVPANDAVRVELLTIGGSELARHEGDVIGGVGIGSGQEGEIGTSFTLAETSRFAGVRFALNDVADPPPPEPPSAWPGQRVVARLRATTVGGRPAELIATTAAITASYQGGVNDVRFEGGDLILPPGRYFVSVVEPPSPAALPLALSLERYEPSTNWVYWPSIPSGDWATLESFGEVYQRAPNISLLTAIVDAFGDGFETPAPPRPAAGAGTTQRASRSQYAGALLARPALD